MTKKVIETVNGWYMENPKQKVELDDIVGLVKTDEPTDSVQLKKEAQLSIYEKRIIELENENEQLKKELKSIEDSFKFSCTENHFEFNKDKLKVEDTHTELILKDGKLCISVFIPQLNEYVKFFYFVTGRKMEREFINYDGDV